MKKLISFVAAILSVGTSFGQVTIDIDDTKEFQTIEGFGGFGPAKPWWEGAPYFDEGYLRETVDNLGVTFFRTQIYWDGEPVNDNGDPNILDATKFKFGSGSDNGKQFPFLKAVSEKGAKLIATVWTPPVWMKLFDDANRKPTECYNCSQCTVGDPGTEMCGGRLNPIYYEEFAEYLVMYVKALKENIGVDLYAISIQNEPYFANPFESNVVLPEEYADILKVVGARFDSEGLTTKFFGPEHMAEWSWGWQTKYVNEILNDPTVKSYLDIYAVHGYVDGVAADYGSAEGWTALYENITEAHSVPLWMTETSDFDLTGFALAFSMSKSLYLAMKFGRISAWVYWAMHEQVIKDNKLTSLGYAFKNYYRFIRPGSMVIEATSSDPEVLVLASKHPDTNDVSIILINNSDAEKNIQLNVPFGHSDLFLYRTSASENCKDLGSVSEVLSLPSKSVSTITTIRDIVTNVQKKSEVSINVYPNPAAKTVSVSLPSTSERFTIQVFDASGRKIEELEVSSEGPVRIDTSRWNAGAYFIQVRGNAACSTFKLFAQ
jgi:glucuronoarabinoxylan endo-1,4-beta-xylanase